MTPPKDCTECPAVKQLLELSVSQAEAMTATAGSVAGIEKTQEEILKAINEKLWRIILVQSGLIISILAAVGLYRTVAPALIPGVAP